MNKFVGGQMLKIISPAWATRRLSTGCPQGRKTFLVALFIYGGL